MSFLNNIFGNSETKNESRSFGTKLNWIALESINQLEEIIDLSKEKPVAIFKHNTRCIISKTVLKNFESELRQAQFDKLEDKIILYCLDLLNYREISNTIASTFTVTHQSPQILVIKNGVCIYHASHESIDAKDLEKYV